MVKALKEFSRQTKGELFDLGSLTERITSKAQAKAAVRLLVVKNNTRIVGAVFYYKEKYPVTQDGKVSFSISIVEKKTEKDISVIDFVALMPQHFDEKLAKRTLQAVVQESIGDNGTGIVVVNPEDFISRDIGSTNVLRFVRSLGFAQISPKGSIDERREYGAKKFNGFALSAPAALDLIKAVRTSPAYDPAKAKLKDEAMTADGSTGAPGSAQEEQAPFYQEAEDALKERSPCFWRNL